MLTLCKLANKDHPSVLVISRVARFGLICKSQGKNIPGSEGGVSSSWAVSAVGGGVKIVIKRPLRCLVRASYLKLVLIRYASS